MKAHVQYQTFNVGTKVRNVSKKNILVGGIHMFKSSAIIKYTPVRPTRKMVVSGIICEGRSIRLQQGMSVRRLQQRKPTSIWASISDISETETISDEIESESLQLIDWPVVCHQVARLASTRSGYQAALSLPLGQSLHASQQLLAQTKAAQACPLTFDGVSDIESAVNAAQKGRVMRGEQLWEVGCTLTAAGRIHDTITECGGPAGALLEAVGDHLTPQSGAALAERITASVGPGGVVLDTASPELGEVRRLKKGAAQQRASALNAIAQHVFQQGASQRPQVVWRRGRACLPVRRGQQGLLPGGGVVLAQSSTGATLFMEPKEVVELNNKVGEMEAAELEEESTVLWGLSEDVAGHAGPLRSLISALTLLDLAAARAKHAAWLGGVDAELHDGAQEEEEEEDENEVRAVVSMRGVSSPVLLEAALPALPSTWEPDHPPPPHGPPATRPTPINFQVPPATRVVTITGPNTGGKTATLKTIGLVAVMAKAGLFVPAESGAVLAWFDKVLVDIGDSQSLEQNLSTFSGHIRRVQGVLGGSTSESLVLLDELGSGTDPTEGAALATTLLNHLAQKERAQLTIATSHYAEVKATAMKNNMFANCAVEFDVEALKPTYRLLWGEVGNSNALDIAAGLGLPGSILSSARDIMATELTSQAASHRQGVLMRSLQSQLEEQSRRTEQVTQAHSTLTQHFQTLQQQADALKKNPEKLREEARIRVQKQKDEMIEALNKAGGGEEKELGESRLGERRKEVERTLRDLMSAAGGGAAGGGEDDAGESSDQQKQKQKQQWQPQVGEQVRLIRVGNSAEVLSVTSGPAGVSLLTVKLGALEMKVKANEVAQMDVKKSAVNSNSQQLGVVGRRGQRNPPSRSRKNLPVGGDTAERPQAIKFASNTCDLRGMRVEEGLDYLDGCLGRRRGGHRAWFVVHGVGTGQMKRAVLEHLKRHSMVSHFERNEGPGGDGCTVAYLK